MLFRLLILIGFIALANPAFGQSPIEGYVAGGVGQFVHSNNSSGSLFVGAGGVEWLPAPYFGIAGEGGVFTGGSGGLMFSLGVDARLHFRGTPAPGEWAPYVFAGYSPLALFDASDHGGQLGAGVDYRLNRRRAIRFEVRDILRQSGSISTHYWTVRVGVTFR